MELQESSRKSVASTALLKEPENQSRVWSTIIYWHYYDSPEEIKRHGFQKHPQNPATKELLSRECDWL